jgi:two-component system, sensor histidine kinase
MHPVFRTLLLNGAAALLYATFAFISTALTRTPEAFTPVWIPAGIATFFMLVSGWKSVPGILAGSLIFHFVTYPPESAWEWEWAWIAENLGYLPITVMQCWSVKLLLYPVIANPSFTTGWRNPLRISIRVACVAMVIPVGVHLLGWTIDPHVEVNTFFLSLFKWWIGDLLGILALIALPTLILQSRHDSNQRSHLPYSIPVVIFLVSILVGYRLIANREESAVQHRFESEVASFNTLLQNDLQHLIDGISLMRITFDHHPEWIRSSFPEMAERLLQSHPAVQALNWMSMIHTDEYEAWESVIRERHPDFRGFRRRIGDDMIPITGTESEPFLLAITQVVPFKGNEPVLGLDLSIFSESILRVAIESGLPVMQSPFRLTQETGEQLGIVMHYPLRVARYDSLAKEYESDTYGLFNIPIRMDDYLLRVWKHIHSQGLFAEISDITHPGNEVLLSRLHNGNVLSRHGQGSPFEAIFAKTTDQQVLNRSWRVHIEAGSEFMSLHMSRTPNVLLAGALLSCFLLGNYTLSNYLRNRQIQHKVAQQTRELRETTRRAEELARAKSEFLAVMSHEIRTPLNGLISTADLLNETTLDPDQKELAGIMDLSAQTLLSLINDILDFSKLGAGKGELHLEAFDPVEVLKCVEATFRARSQEKGLKLQVTAPETKGNAPARLVGDRSRLLQILMNLVSNAIKFTDRGEIHITCSIDPVPEQRARLIYTVQDTGVGIAADKLDELFEPFTQADPSNTRRFGGSGLGLAIVKQLVDLFGGSIEVQSQPQLGSTFRVSMILDLA